MNTQLLECAGKNSPFFPSFNDLRIFGGGQGGISHFYGHFMLLDPSASSSLCWILWWVYDCRSALRGSLGTSSAVLGSFIN